MYNVLNRQKSVWGNRSSNTILLQELDYIVAAEQTNDTTAPFDPMLTDKDWLVIFIYNVCSVQPLSKAAILFIIFSHGDQTPT